MRLEVVRTVVRGAVAWLSASSDARDACLPHLPRGCCATKWVRNACDSVPTADVLLALVRDGRRRLPQVGELDAGRDALPEHAWSPDEHEQDHVIMLQKQVNEFYEVRVMKWRGG